MSVMYWLYSLKQKGTWAILLTWVIDFLKIYEEIMVHFSSRISYAPIIKLNNLSLILQRKLWTI